jgi:galactose mutarotase-like enzyme
MSEIIQNNKVKVIIADHGAEIVSLYDMKNSVEHIYNANEKYWKRRSPILFPVVGSFKNKEFSYKGKTYMMWQHGFARDMDFKKVSNDGKEVWMSLTSSEETKEKYPFDFELRLGYKLTDSNELEVLYNVKNTSDSEDMYFSIGAHPAFMIPGVKIDAFAELEKALSSRFKKSDAMNVRMPGMLDILPIGPEREYPDANECGMYDYMLLFKDVKDNKLTVGKLMGAGLLSEETFTLELTPVTIDGVNYGGVKLSKELFVADALVIENNQTQEVMIAKEENGSWNKAVDVKFDAPLFGIWSPAGKDAPFVCIEPWYGRCDSVNFEGDLTEREYEQKLAPGAEFNASYTITI